MKHLTMALLVGLTVAAPAAAGIMRAEESAGNKACFNESATVNINYRGSADSPSDIIGKADGQMAIVKKEAEKIGITSFELQNHNYSINNSNHRNDGGDYNYNGNMNFKVEPATKAPMLMEALTEQNYQVSINVNKYRKQPCQ